MISHSMIKAKLNLKNMLVSRYFYGLLIMLIFMPACGSPRYLCEDSRASYYCVDGKYIETNRGISNGYVFIPEPGDAGSFMIGTYARIENGLLVETYRGVPPIIEKHH